MKDDSISRQAALKGLEDLNIASFYEDNEHSKEAYTEVKAMLKALPSAQSEIIRCIDCKHSPLKTWFECPLAHLRFDGDRWCWKGEREDGDNG